MGSETHECPRCACQWDARNGAYRDECIEWIQHCDRLEQGYRQQIARLEDRLVHMGWDLDYYRTLCGYLVVPSQEQIELIALRAQLAEIERGGAAIASDEPSDLETVQPQVDG